MPDETFRLTALDVRRYEFGGALRGYDKAAVDRFREQVAAEVERLTRANQELEARARSALEQLKAFRERDRALNEALVSAQQLRAETREQADKEAELIRREAQLEAERIVHEAHEVAQMHAEQLRGEVRRLEDEIAGMDRVHRTYLAQLRLMAERQIAELQAAEERTLPPFGRMASLGAGARMTPAAGLDVQEEQG